jgi:hypothetical protein
MMRLPCELLPLLAQRLHLLHCDGLQMILSPGSSFDRVMLNDSASLLTSQVSSSGNYVKEANHFMLAWMTVPHTLVARMH